MTVRSFTIGRLGDYLTFLKQTKIINMESVIKCEKIKEWNGKPIYGIGLSDGQGGESFIEIPVGTPINELVITANPPYGNKIKWNKPNAGGYGGGKQRSGNESFALSYAKDVVCAGKTDLKNVFDLADKMYLWLEKKKAGDKQATPPSTVKTEDDSLPF